MIKINKLEKKGIEDIVALTPMQEGMLFHYLKDFKSDHYFEQLCLDVTGKIDIICFEKAWNFVIQTNEMLRTAFRWKKVKKPVQVVLKNFTLKLRYYDLSEKESSVRTKLLDETIAKDREEKFDLSRVPFRITLCKLEKYKYKVVITNHHILYDGWSSGIILKEFFKAYHHLAKGNQVTAPPVKTKFKEYVRWLQTLQIQDAQKQKEFWQDYLKGFDEQIELSIKRKNQQGQKGVFHHSLRFSPAVTEELEYLVKSSNITIAALLYSAWGILLQRYNNCDDVLFGTTVSGRTAKIKGIEDMAGLFINTVPLRIQNHPPEKAADLLDRIDKTMQKRQEYEHTSLVDIKKYSETDNREELFDSVMIVENYPLETRFMPVESELSLRVDSYSMLEQTHYDLIITALIDQDIEVAFCCKRELFDQDCIVRLSNHFRCITENMIKNTGGKVSDIEIISAEERNKILYEFNNTNAEYPMDKTIHQLFAEQVERTPDRIAIVGSWQLAVDNNVTLTYRELNEKSNQLAHLLLEQGVQSHTIVAIMVGRSIEMIVGILAILQTGGAYLPMDPDYPQERIDYMLADSAAKLLLTSDAINRVPTPSHLHLSPAPVTSLAYIIYTSGSTGKPKGVMIPHQAVHNFIEGITQRINFTPGKTILALTTISFDIFVLETLLPLSRGLGVVIAGEHLQKDLLLLGAFIVKHGVDMLQATPTRMQMFTHCINGDRSSCLKNLEEIMVGGEPLPKKLLKELQLLTSARIYNMYGPTETTVWSTMKELTHAEEVTIGRPIANTQIYILNKNHLVQPVGVIGDLYIGGNGLARGYLNRPQLTAEKFILATKTQRHKDVYFSRCPGALVAKLYKTGDLARWLPGGNIEFLGRIDHQVKIRGFRIEPGEIENRLLSHENVKEAIVIDRETSEGEKYLSAYYVSKKQLNGSQLREYLLKELPDYMIPAYFSQIDNIPFTPSGKIDRQALPRPKIKSGKDYTPPRNEIERKLAEIWWQILNKEERPSSHLSIGIDENFFSIGGHSLKVVRMTGRIHKALNIYLPLGQVFETPTIRGLAHYINKTKEILYCPVEPVEKKEYYALSPVQKRLFVLQQKEPVNPIYHITGMKTAEGKLHEDKFEDSFKKLIDRHESLRTSFKLLEGEPVQEIHRDVEFEIERLSAPGGGSMPHAGIIKRFVRPFDLSRAPLVRIGLIEVDKKEHILVIDMHHIISDGTSAAVLTEELVTVYAGGPLPGLRIQYKDYAQWQKDESRWETQQIKKQEDFWLKAFQPGDEVPVLNLPTDYRRPHKRYFEGDTLNAEIGKEQTDSLRQLSSKTGTTLFTVLLASFYLFLSKLSGQEDIIVATPVAGRTHNDLEGLIGMFVNTLALRNYPHGQKTFFEFLLEVKDNFLASLENQDYPYDELVEKVVFNRALNRNPLFDVMLVLQNMESKELEIPGLKLKPSNYENNISKFDMTFTLLEKEDRLYLSISYSTILFKKETIGRFIKYFKSVLGEIPGNTHKKLLQIEIIPGAEREQLLYVFNETEIPYPTGKTIHQLFEERVEKQLDNGAAVFGNKHITYGYLNERANRLAQALQARGVKPGAIVGLMVGRSPEMVLGMMAILKAGGAYLPLDPAYPGKRKKYMLEDSQSVLLLTDGQKEEVDRCLWDDMEIPDIRQLHQYCAGAGNTHRINQSSDLAYVTYTSGSAGTPKGVMVEHRNAVNVVLWFGGAYRLGQNTHVLQMSEYTFDPSVNQVFGTLLHGAVLHLISKENLFNVEFLRQYIEVHQVHVINFVPQFLNTLLDVNYKFKSIRQVLSGGEKLDDYIKNSIIEKGYELYNQYGPTETTIDALVEKCSTDKVTLGKPISNVRCYILDRYNNLAPIGIPGELYVAGAGVARGYLNNPELTTEKFIKLEINMSYMSHMSNIYKTGDLAKWLSTGKIEFLGRIDQQVKIRGFRIELAEIENQLLRIEEIKETVVILLEASESPGGSVPDNTGDKYLCAYIVSDSPFEPLELKEYLSGELPDYMIPLYFVQLESLPLTATGKIDKSALPGPETRKNRIAPANVMEEILTKIWSEVLGVIEVDISMDSNFFELGGHSLNMTVIAAKIHRELDIKIPLQELFSRLTIRELAEYLKENVKEKYLSITPVEKKEYYPTSSAQKRLYVLQQMNLNSTHYNMPWVVIMEGQLQLKKLEKIFKKLIKRHESLRTSFQVKDKELVQKLHEAVDFKIEYYDLTTEGIEEGRVEDKEAWAHHSSFIIHHSFIRPFNLSRASLLRVGLIKIGDSRHIFMVDMHHIAADGASIEIFLEEFTLLYQEKELAPIQIRYKDYAQWCNTRQEKEKIEKQETYWLKVLAGELPIIKLPTDFNRPAVQNFEGSSIDFEIGYQQVERLREIALREDATLHMVVLAIFNILLSRLSGQDDIIIGAPTAGRQHADLQHTIGMFVNTLVLRNYLPQNKTFNEFLEKTRERTLEAFDNQDFPFEDLVDRLAARGDMSRNPLFDVMFDLQKTGRVGLDLPGLKLKPYPYDITISKFDMSWIGEEVGKRLVFKLEYSTKLFKKETILGFTRYFKRITAAAAEYPGKKITAIEIISREEKKQILFDLNDTREEYPGNQTLHRLFEKQVEKTPAYMALVGQIPGRTGGLVPWSVHVTYKELNEKSNQLARLLREKGVHPDTIVGIMGERSVEMIVGILGILKAGGAYLPINPEYPETRKKIMIKDSKALTLVTRSPLTEEHKQAIENMIEEITYIDDMDMYDESFYLPSPPLSSLNRPNNSSNSAYLIYTSGTTGNPKGVLVEHRNAVNVVSWFGRQYRLRSGFKVLQMSDYTFDASVNQVFATLLHGAILYVIDKHLLLNIDELRKYIDKEGINLVNFVPTLLKPLLCDGKKLESLKIVISGAEKLEDVTKEKILEKGYILYNHYGPTETTIDALASKCSREKVNLGKPISNAMCYILDKYGNVLPIGVTGELYVSGAGVARGYLNRPALTSGSFTVNPFLPGKRMYRTGDLVRRLLDGNIEFMGRIDNQVKIRGHRVELADIESQLLKHSQIKEAIATSRTDEKGGKYLCAYLVPGKEFEVSQLREYLSGSLPGYMIPSHFSYIEKIPLTSSGKIDKDALPVPEIKGKKDYIAPGNALEVKLVEIWSDVLGVKKGAVSIDADFFELGGHSLRAIMIISKIHKAMDVRVPLAVIFKSPTLGELAEYIKRAEEEKYASIVPAEKRTYYAISSAQRRLYVLRHMDEPGTGTGYNIPSMWLLEGDIVRNKLENTFLKLIRRHESLRTSFHMVNGEPAQRIRDEVEFEIEYKEVKVKVEEEPESRELRAKSCIYSFIRPFDLSQAPLLRVGLIKLLHTPTALRGHPSQQGKEDRYLLMVDMHHIIADGISMKVLIKDFMALYWEDELPDLEIQYKDFSEWQNSYAQKQVIKLQEAYWLKQFEGEVPVLNLPTDYPRPLVRNFEGRSIYFEIDRQKNDALKSLAGTHGVTLYMALLSIYTTFLSKLTDQEDVVVGTPAAGRRHADLTNLIGMFVNTLALRNFPIEEKTFTQLLKEVNERTLEAFENQDYPFEDLVEQVDINRDTGRNPLFDNMFALQDYDIPGIEIPGLKLKPYKYENRTAKFDLLLQCIEKEDKLFFTFEYSTQLFALAAIERFIDYFKKILFSVIENPGNKLWEIEIITGKEKREILHEFNDTGSEYPTDKTIHRLFEEQVRRTPDNIAVIGQSLGAIHESPLHLLPLQISYRELNEKSDQLAHLLGEKGVLPDTIVGIMPGQSIEMITGILAILKAGAAYMPIDPEYPQDRIDYMIKDSSVKILVTVPGLSEKFEKLLIVNCQLLMVNENPPNRSINNYQLTINNLQLEQSNLAYVIYTSGTTGKPKGTLIQHGNVVRLMRSDKFQFDFNPDDVWTMFHSCCFDFSVWEMYGALLYGGQLVVIPKMTAMDTSGYLEILKKKQVTILNQTPSAFYSLMNLELEHPGQELNVRYVIFGGEALTPTRLKGWKAKYPHTKLINMYGITETTVHVTFKEIGHHEIESHTSNIGKPIPTSSAHITDKYLDLQPIGIPGELCVGGHGVGRGYLNQPELTSEKFISPSHMSYMSHRSYIYKSGDLARRLPNGEIEYLGRIDQQVKIRGHRIEPGEIESRLLSHQAIEDTAVLPKETVTRDKYLCAYIVSNNKITVSELREYLSMKLPNYMIPSHFIPIEKIPLTSSGKIDGKSLPEPDESRPILETAYAAPKTNLQRTIAGIWQKVLNLDKVGIHDNLFDLGGNSLDVIKINSQLKIVLGKDIPLLELFQYPTVHSFSTYLHREKDDEAAPAAPGKQTTDAVDLMEETMQMLIGDENG